MISESSRNIDYDKVLPIPLRCLKIVFLKAHEKLNVIYTYRFSVQLKVKPK